MIAVQGGGGTRASWSARPVSRRPAAR